MSVRFRLHARVDNLKNSTPSDSWTQHQDSTRKFVQRRSQCITSRTLNESSTIQNDRQHLFPSLTASQPASQPAGPYLPYLCWERSTIEPISGAHSLFLELFPGDHESVVNVKLSITVGLSNATSPVGRCRWAHCYMYNQLQPATSGHVQVSSTNLNHCHRRA